MSRDFSDVCPSCGYQCMTVEQCHRAQQQNATNDQPVEAPYFGFDSLTPEGKTAYRVGYDHGTRDTKDESAEQPDARPELQIHGLDQETLTICSMNPDGTCNVLLEMANGSSDLE